MVQACIRCYFMIFVCLRASGYSISLDRISGKIENYPIATTTEQSTEITTKLRYEQDLANNEAASNARQGKALMDEDHDFIHDHLHDHDIIVEHPPVTEMKEETKQSADSWTSYYEFIITEGSFKFWAAFQLFTALLLIYSSLAAAYYAKFNVITTDYDYYDDFFGRSNNDAPSTSLWSGLTSSTMQRIYDAISSKKYT